MSKLKTKRGAAKRFSFTGTGKVKRNKAYHRHNMTTQPKKAKMEGRKSVLLDKADVPLVKRMLPYGA